MNTLSNLCALQVAKSIILFKTSLAKLPEELLQLILEKLQQIGDANETNIALLLHPPLRSLHLSKCINDDRITDKIFSYLPCMQYMCNT